MEAKLSVCPLTLSVTKGSVCPLWDVENFPRSICLLLALGKDSHDMRLAIDRLEIIKHTPSAAVHGAMTQEIRQAFDSGRALLHVLSSQQSHL